MYPTTSRIVATIFGIGANSITNPIKASRMTLAPMNLNISLFPIPSHVSFVIKEQDGYLGIKNAAIEATAFLIQLDRFFSVSEPTPDHYS